MPDHIIFLTLITFNPINGPEQHFYLPSTIRRGSGSNRLLLNTLTSSRALGAGNKRRKICEWNKKTDHRLLFPYTTLDYNSLGEAKGRQAE